MELLTRLSFQLITADVEVREWIGCGTTTAPCRFGKPTNELKNTYPGMDFFFIKQGGENRQRQEAKDGDQ